MVLSSSPSLLRDISGLVLGRWAFEGLLFTKDCSSQFPNLGSVELLPCGSRQGFFETELPKKSAIVMFLFAFFLVPSF